jgi:hypothetical protein
MVYVGAEVLKCLKMQNQETKKLMLKERRCFEKPEIIAACPFCNTMTDGIKTKKKEGDVKVWTLQN